MTEIVKGKVYRIYGKVEGMSRMQALSGDTFTNRLIFADLFTIKTDEDVKKFNRELDFLKTQGEFEAREVVDLREAKED